MIGFLLNNNLAPIGFSMKSTCSPADLFEQRARNAVLSISFEVDVPTEKVGGNLLSECQRWELPRGVWGHAPQKILKFRCLEMLFATFSRQYLGLENNQNYAL